MLLSLFGLVANGITAWPFTAGARRWWSFRAALAHELSDGAMTVAGLVGAGAIAVFGWTRVDPALSLPGGGQSASSCAARGAARSSGQRNRSWSRSR